MDAITLQRAEESIEGWRPKSVEGLANDAVAAGTAWKARAGN